jgi:hypothetical protein
MAHMAAQGGRHVAAPQMVPPGTAARSMATVRPEDIDEVGGVGDELDSISLRDVAAIRYMRHQEWLEMVLGTAVETHKIKPCDIIPADNSLFKSNDPKTIEEYLEKVRSEVAELEKEAADGWKDLKQMKSEFYRSTKLQQELGAISSEPKSYERAVGDLEKEFGVTVVERKRVTKVEPALEVNQNGPKKQDNDAVEFGDDITSTMGENDLEGLGDDSLMQDMLKDDVLEDVLNL